MPRDGEIRPRFEAADRIIVATARHGIPAGHWLVDNVPPPPPPAPPPPLPPAPSIE